MSDDIIVTGGTLIAGAEALLEAGATEVYACATHGLFPGNALREDRGERDQARSSSRTRSRSTRSTGRTRSTCCPSREPAGRDDPERLRRRLGLGDLRRREPALLTRIWALVAVTAAVTAATAVAHFADAPALLTFALATVALAGLAWIVSFSTEQVGQRYGPAVTGVLQSTLGNLPEFFIVIFALSAGELVVARDLDPRLDLRQRAARARPRDRGRLPREQRRRDALPDAPAEGQRDPDAAGELPDRADRASRPRPRTRPRTTSRRSRSSGAVALLLTYGVWLVDYLRSDPPREGGDARPRVSLTPRARAAGRRRRGVGVRLRLVRHGALAGDGEDRRLEGVRRARGRRRSPATRSRTRPGSCSR